MNRSPPPEPLQRRIARFGDYQVLGVLGRGGMATVTIARPPEDRALPSLVALKFLHTSFLEDADAVDAFEQEALLGMSLSHESLCRTYAIERVGSRSAIVMEYLQGRPLARLFRTLQATGTSERSHMVAAHVVVCLARALQVVHDARASDGTPLHAVHRDVTPQNVILTRDGGVKLVDFGVAFSETRKLKTKKGLVKGKVAYLSPEYLLGRPWDHRVDVWSLGVLFWEFLTGTRLFAIGPTTRTMRDVMLAVIPSPRHYSRSVPPEFEAVAMSALQRNPSDRIRTAGEMAQALERALGETELSRSRERIETWLSSLPLGQDERENDLELDSDQRDRFSPNPAIEELSEADTTGGVFLG